MKAKPVAGKKKLAVIPLRVPADLKERIEGLAKISRVSEADVMRQAIDRGIGDLEEFFRKPAKAAA